MTTILFIGSVTDKKVAWSTQETNFVQFWEVDTFLHSRPLCVTSQVFTFQKIPCVALGEGADGACMMQRTDQYFHTDAKQHCTEFTSKLAV